MTSASTHAPGEILIISRDEVEQLLTPAACYERCLETFRWVGSQQVEQVNPVNLYVTDRSLPEPTFGHGVIQAFPAMIRPLDRAAVKWLGSYRRNPVRGLPAISAIDLVSDTTTGMPLALIDGTSVTNMRTGGHAAVGANFLAKPDSERVAIVGCGNEGRTHLLTLAHLFPISKVFAFDTDLSKLATFAQEMSDALSIEVEQSPGVKEAVREADIICIVTTASEPVIRESWVPEGAHLCAATGFRDVDIDCAKAFDKWVVGSYDRDLEWIEGPETGRIGGLEHGALSRTNVYADLATEIIPGSLPGREHAHERTLMTHMGMPALDASVASLVYDLALDQGVGTWIRVF